MGQWIMAKFPRIWNLLAMSHSINWSTELWALPLSLVCPFFFVFLEMVPRKEEQESYAFRQFLCWNMTYTVEPLFLNLMHNSKLSAIMWVRATVCVGLYYTAEETLVQPAIFFINNENQNTKKKKIPKRKSNIQKWKCWLSSRVALFGPIGRLVL